MGASTPRPGQSAAQNTTFDGPRFAAWLRRWLKAEDLGVREVARRSGLSDSMMQQLVRGTPQTYAASLGQTAIDPRFSTIARLADGLGLEFVYVASKAWPLAEVDRWSNFTQGERRLLREVLEDARTSDASPELLHLLAELQGNDRNGGSSA